MLILLNAIAILYGTLMPNEWVRNISNQVRKTVHELYVHEAAPQKSQPPAAKPAAYAPAVPLFEQIYRFADTEVKAHTAGHFVLFATLCFLMYCSAALERQHPDYFFKVGMDVMLFAAITESLQFLTLDRNADVGDLRIDLYGMALALVVFLCILPLIRRWQAALQRKDPVQA